MHRTAAALVLLALAAAPAAAQETPARRPPADTIRIVPREPAGDSIRMADAEFEEAERTPAARRDPGPFDLPAGPGPFAVQTSGRVAPRPPAGEVVYAGTRAPARAAARDTTRSTPRDTAAAPARTAAETPPRTPAAEPARTTIATTTTITTTTPRPAPDPRARTHTVEPGETFFGIARRYGVQPAQLRALNPGVDPDVLEVGDVLQLPAAARDSRVSTSPAQPAAEPQPRASAAGEASVPRGSRTHVVAAGETLFGIARRYGVSAAEIVRVNRLESDQVRIGQRLLIPPAAN